METQRRQGCAGIVDHHAARGAAQLSQVAAVDEVHPPRQTALRRQSTRDGAQVDQTWVQRVILDHQPAILRCMAREAVHHLCQECGIVGETGVAQQLSIPFALKTDDEEGTARLDDVCVQLAS
ncbi:hypothetical protein D3C85_1502660 [compost metagenome]